jgi:hypothetical protein
MGTRSLHALPSSTTPAWSSSIPRNAQTHLTQFLQVSTQSHNTNSFSEICLTACFTYLVDVSVQLFTLSTKVCPTLSKHFFGSPPSRGVLPASKKVESQTLSKIIFGSAQTREELPASKNAQTQTLSQNFFGSAQTREELSASKNAQTQTLSNCNFWLSTNPRRTPNIEKCSNSNFDKK